MGEKVKGLSKQKTQKHRQQYGDTREKGEWGGRRR